MAIDGFAKSLIDLLLQFMLELPPLDLNDWNDIDENEEEVDEPDNSVIGQVSYPILYWIDMCDRRDLIAYVRFLEGRS